MALTHRFLGAGKFLMLTCALLFTYLAFALIGMRGALRAREVTVPDLSDSQVNEAMQVLSQTDLVLQIEDQRRIHSTIKKGQVVAQDPPAGVKTRRQRTVKVWLSSGLYASEVPTLLGESEQGARRRLEQDALELASVSEIRSEEYPTGAVLAQEPPPRTIGREVSVLINRGERGNTYVMPDLIAVEFAGAAEILRARGFRITIVGDHLYPGIPEGIVLRQSPRPGFQIAPGESISLEVSR